MNAAVFDSIAIGIAKRLEAGPIKDFSGLKAAYDKLVAVDRYIQTTSRATADETSVSDRLALATDAFAKVK